MKKNDIFTFTANNGVEVLAVCLNVTCMGGMTQYLCYAQNRLFYINEYYSKGVLETGEVVNDTMLEEGEIIVDYAVLPDYDVKMEYYYQNKEED